MVKLVYKDKNFIEGASEGEAFLDIDDDKGVAMLSFSPSASLITKRTAGRQARGICKTGFLLKNGKRVGGNCELRVEEDTSSVDERLLQEGHHYR
ncbi:MAG: hypothetical protein ACXADA_01205 [Candidatus Hodarchaeales archaeon]